MGFLDSIWARLAGGGTASAAGAGSTAPVALAPSVPASQPSVSRGRIEGLALRMAGSLTGEFADLERVKWVLLQPEVDAAARRFASLAGLGESRAAEASEAREALAVMLRADLACEERNSIDELLDAMQREVRRGSQRSAQRFSPQAHTERAEPIAQAPPIEEPVAAVEPETVWTRPASTVSEEPGGASIVRPEGSSPPQDGSLASVEYELHVLAGSSTRDVDTGLVREYVQGAALRRPASSLVDLSWTDVLRLLKAIDGPAGEERMTVLGGLFFAARPESLVVQSKVRFVEFAGTEVASGSEQVAYRYSEEVTGTIPQLIARMERLHKERLAPGVLGDGFRVEEVPSVPLFALREAMVNAVCHRDYSLVGANIQVRLFDDRLEIQSPGGLPGPVTLDNIESESYARNPRVADMLRDLGYVERHGLGIDNMIRSMADAHLPPPEFTDRETSFTVTLRFRPPDEADPGTWLDDIGAGKLDADQRKALVYARRMGRIDSAEYQALTLADETEADTELRALVRAGWLLRAGKRGEVHYALGPRTGSAEIATGGGVSVPESVLDSLPKSQRRILDIVVRQGRAKASEVLEISGLKDRRTIQRALAALVERGLVVRRASSRTDPNATYEVASGIGDDEGSPDRA